MRTWTKVWASRLADPRVRAAGAAGIALYVQLSALGEDGALPEDQVAGLLGSESLAALLASGALVRRRGKVCIRPEDFARDQPAREAGKARREAGKAGAKARWSRARTRCDDTNRIADLALSASASDSMPQSVTTESMRLLDAVAFRMQKEKEKEKEKENQIERRPEPAPRFARRAGGSPSEHATRPRTKPANPTLFPVPDPPTTALPFPVKDLLPIIAEHGPRRFTAGMEERHIARKHAVRLAALIRAFPTREEWVALIAWLDEGGLPNFPAPYTLDLLCSDSARQWMAAAREWDQSERPDLGEIRARQRIEANGHEYVAGFFRRNGKHD